MPHRYFASEFTETTAALTGPDAHHLGRVMRAKAGDEVILCDGAGFDYTAAVTAVAPDRVEFRLLEKRPTAAEPSVEVTLFAGYPKQDKLEFIVQKAVELGAARVVPFFSRFCVAAPKKEDQKNLRYARIAAEAAKQAGRGLIPAVELPLDIKDLPARFDQFDLVLFFYEGGGQSLRTLVKDQKRIALITGAEGGFSPEEAEKLIAAGAVPVGLGPRILRCETAPVAALAAVMTLAGQLE
ncbi:MAG TPA: 16S rRNA (uracil(1498)-N(3))-methyltransferase [Candidatus Fournierella pullicola]|uniref:Ribosomal RNA small subunit methyltransferase E n=1 Tax=Candidatus Allofournierella pullicola TaxID=2838596 RepID=A0A9D1V4J1_9FIRM|nr:16S rRNA (uracil(1498)-N(3))-methyltransferase [Candidatus Fournierella pullicola]